MLSESYVLVVQVALSQPEVARWSLDRNPAMLNCRDASEELGFPQGMVLNSISMSNAEPGTKLVVVFDFLNMFNVKLAVAFRVLDVDVEDVRACLRASKAFQGVTRVPRGCIGIRQHCGSTRR